MFHTVLVANRGEIAVRVLRTLRAMGVRSVAVYTDVDAGARHAREADEAVGIGPARAYLDADRIVEAALRTGAQAVHPGYGFLAENAAFATACEAAELVFVGPPASAIETMGDKIQAKRTVAAAGVPVVPGLIPDPVQPRLSDTELARAAEETGFPVLLKPSAGGGGKGMRLVTGPGELAEAVASARREAMGAFGDDTLLVERYLERPRHIEVQVLADSHGSVVHLGERECSLQRRHQKIVEEAPSPLLDEGLRAAFGDLAVRAARAVGYTGAGTVECIVAGGRPSEPYFMEMNTRLQVEHPVTELVTGLDLVEWQLRVAAGERLAFTQDDVALTGHAVEARVYAEDPERGFLPSGGRVLAVREPAGPGVRVDSGIAAGSVVGGEYDPLLAKVIAWGPDRAAALARLEAALAGTAVLGVVTNVGFLRALLADEDVAAGRLDTGLVERRLDSLVAVGPPPEAVLAAAALERLLALTPPEAGPNGTRWSAPGHEGPQGADPWDVPSGWRLGEPAWTSWQVLVAGHDPVEVRTRGLAGSAEVVVGDGPARPASATRAGDDLVVTLDGRVHRFATARAGEVLWLAAGGRAWPITERGRLEAARSEPAEGAGGPVRSPMPGTVIAVKAAVGERVAAGQALVTVEAMKMEHTVTAPVDGVVTELPVTVGQQVALDQSLAVVSAAEGSAG
jgi:acetyl-CoA/propionyl-CoA carboxylase biotin carboxyl carrier protein